MKLMWMLEVVTLMLIGITLIVESQAPTDQGETLKDKKEDLVLKFGPSSVAHIHGKSCEMGLYKKYSHYPIWNEFLVKPDDGKKLKAAVDKWVKVRESMTSKEQMPSCTLKTNPRTGIGLECLKGKCACPTSGAFRPMYLKWNGDKGTCESSNGDWCVLPRGDNNDIKINLMSECEWDGRCEKNVKTDKCFKEVSRICVLNKCFDKGKQDQFWGTCTGGDEAKWNAKKLKNIGSRAREVSSGTQPRRNGTQSNRNGTQPNRNETNRPEPTKLTTKKTTTPSPAAAAKKTYSCPSSTGPTTPTAFLILLIGYIVMGVTL